MKDRKEKAYRAQLKRCYKYRIYNTSWKDQKPRLKISWIFKHIYEKRDRTVNGPFRPGKVWLREQIERVKQLKFISNNPSNEPKT